MGTRRKRRTVCRGKGFCEMKDTMGIRMVAMDMDGTLLLPDGTISPRAARALVGCEERGIQVILASGRSFFNIRAYYKQLGLKSPMLSVNGVRGDASCMGPLIFDSFLPEAVTRAILPILRAEKVHFDLFTRYDIYDEFLDAHFNFHNVPELVLEDGMRHEIIVEQPRRTDVEGAPCAYKLIAMSRDVDKLARIRAALQDFPVDIASSGWDNLEIIQPGINKGTGLARLAAHYGIAREQVMAFGDYWNDAEMLEWAGESFAMENAVPEIRARAKYIAPSNAEDGVARIIEELLLC